MIRRQSPDSIPAVDYTSLGWIVRTDGGAYGMPASVIVARESPHGLIVYRRVPCATLEEARAVAAVTTPAGL